MSLYLKHHVRFPFWYFLMRDAKFFDLIVVFFQIIYAISVWQNKY